MDSLCKFCRRRHRGAALVIVLAFVVLVTGLVVAYLSRTTGDRQVAHSSFNQSKADQLVQSAMDNVIGDLRQEIASGSIPSAQADGTTLYTPNAAANMVPQRSGNPSGAPNPIPNLIRRSWSDDSNLLVRSRASAVNSAPADPANPNRGDITLVRWNKHYFIPKADTSNDQSNPVASFTAPDWVFVNNQGAIVINDANSPVIGRYAYAIYDESGLLDTNVAGYPTGTTVTQSG